MFFPEHTMFKDHVYINTVIVDKKKFSDIINRIDARHANFCSDAISAKDFKLWCIFATIFGIFTNYGNINSTKLFMECLACNYLPEISILERNDNVKICIKIMQKRLHERKTGINSSTKGDSTK